MKKNVLVTQDPVIFFQRLWSYHLTALNKSIIIIIIIIIIIYYYDIHHYVIPSQPMSTDWLHASWAWLIKIYP